MKKNYFIEFHDYMADDQIANTCCLMFNGTIFIVIHLKEQKVSRILIVLHEIKSSDSRLFYASAAILQGSLDESIFPAFDNLYVYRYC